MAGQFRKVGVIAVTIVAFFIECPQCDMHSAAHFTFTYSFNSIRTLRLYLSPCHKLDWQRLQRFPRSHAAGRRRFRCFKPTYIYLQNPCSYTLCGDAFNYNLIKWKQMIIFSWKLCKQWKTELAYLIATTGVTLQRNFI